MKERKIGRKGDKGTQTEDQKMEKEKRQKGKNKEKKNEICKMGSS